MSLNPNAWHPTQSQAELGASLSLQGSTSALSWLPFCVTGQAAEHGDFGSSRGLDAVGVFQEVSVPSTTAGGGCTRSRDVPKWPVHGPSSGKGMSCLLNSGLPQKRMQYVGNCALGHTPKGKEPIKKPDDSPVAQHEQRPPLKGTLVYKWHQPRGWWSCCLILSESINHFFNLCSSNARRTLFFCTFGVLSSPKMRHKQHSWEQSATCRPSPCQGKDPYLLTPLTVVLMPRKRFHNRNNYKPVMKITDLPWSREVLRVQLHDKRKQSRDTLGSALLLKMSCLCYSYLIVMA